MTVPESLTFVGERLRCWKLTAACNPRNQFIELMRLWGDLPKNAPIWEGGSRRRKVLSQV